MLVDSHCHLDCVDLKPFDNRFENLLADIGRHGVEHMLCVSINMEDYPGMVSLVEGYDSISLSVGLHPNERGGRDPEVDELLQLAKHPKNVAIGETGLDYFRSEGETDWQRDRFRRHIAAAKASGKPLIVHSRDASDDTLRILREEGAHEVGGVMHCFTGDWEMARAAMDMHFYISFSGIVTFKNAQQLKDVARKMPLDRLLVETDSPYLAPIPYRGKPNQPAYVCHVAEHLAELRDEPFEKIAEATTRNFYALFKAVG